MPKTNFQKILFSVLMSFLMVYGMEVYNRAILNKGMTNAQFLLPFNEVIGLMLIVMILQTFVGGPLARKLAFRMIDHKNDKPITIILTIQVMTVCIMCPTMSLVATILYKGGFSSQMLAIWVQTIAINFPMAFFWQILVAGPIVRNIITIVDKKQMSHMENKSLRP